MYPARQPRFAPFDVGFSLRFPREPRPTRKKRSVGKFSTLFNLTKSDTRMPQRPPYEAHADVLLHPREAVAESADDDPMRQLFRRHANHVLGTRARQIRNRLRLKLFAELRPADAE